MTITTNLSGTRTIDVSDAHLRTLNRYSLLSNLLDSNGIVDDAVLQKLRLNARALLAHHADDPELLDLCQQVLFHDNMKAHGLHQLILLYLDWDKA
ncbi:MAG: hypothetical protein IJ197_02180 [Bacteroidaceae bacterium]|nr:hypothetical protein [Bacteroidaceae bacterium]